MATREITTRDELLHQLSVAAELEQGLCLQYLFTGFSLKDALGEGGLTLEELNHVRTWKANIFFVAAQEMLHLAQVANLCAAVGGTVQLHRPNFPQRPGYYPTGLPWGLWPFSPEAIELYAFYERPATWDGGLPPQWPEEGPLERGDFDRLLADAPAGKDPFAHLPGHFRRPRTVAHETIGELYEAIAQAIRTIPNVIIGDPRVQVDGAMVDFPQLIQVFTVDDAVRAIDLIVEQGEGAPADRDDSHFGVFVGIYEDCLRMREERPEFAPARDVQSNPLSRLHVDNTFPGWRLIEDPFTRAVNDLNSETYEVMLRMLYLFFAAPTYETPTLPELARSFLRVMTTVIKPLGEIITRLPMGDSSSGAAGRARFAGPSFEVGQVILPPAHQPAAWFFIGERLDELAAACAALAARPAAPADLEEVAQRLRQVAADFRRIMPAPAG